MKTVWRVEKRGSFAFLIGTAHFFPHRFTGALKRLIQPAETVVFEGPLDEASMARVVEYGQDANNGLALYHVLDPHVVSEINRRLTPRPETTSTVGSYFDLIHPASEDFLKDRIRDAKPWMAFFIVWSAFLGWKHSMDLEAYAIARKLGKKIEYLESIEDQLAALDGIPFDNIVNYLNHFDRWNRHKDLYVKSFLSGDLDKFSSMTGEFPTRCESILARRDPVFFERMKTFFNHGQTAIFVGTAHIPGVRDRFLNDGYEVVQEER